MVLFDPGREEGHGVSGTARRSHSRMMGPLHIFQHRVLVAGLLLCMVGCLWSCRKSDSARTHDAPSPTEQAPVASARPLPSEPSEARQPSPTTPNDATSSTGSLDAGSPTIAAPLPRTSTVSPNDRATAKSTASNQPNLPNPTRRPAPKPGIGYDCGKTYCNDQGVCFSPSPPDCRR